jgi:hypothetical protein
VKTWVHLVRRPLFGLLYQPRMIDDDECRAVGGMRTGRGNRSTRRQPVPVPLCLPQIPHDLTWDRIRASAVGSRRLTTWAMARSALYNNSQKSFRDDDYDDDDETILKKQPCLDDDNDGAIQDACSLRPLQNMDREFESSGIFLIISALPCIGRGPYHESIPCSGSPNKYHIFRSYCWIRRRIA